MFNFLNIVRAARKLRDAAAALDAAAFVAALGDLVGLAGLSPELDLVRHMVADAQAGRWEHLLRADVGALLNLVCDRIYGPLPVTAAGPDAPLMVAAVPPDAVACCRELTAIGAAVGRLAA